SVDPHRPPAALEIGANQVQLFVGCIRSAPDHVPDGAVPLLGGETRTFENGFDRMALGADLIECLFRLFHILTQAGGDAPEQAHGENKGCRSIRTLDHQKTPYVLIEFELLGFSLAPTLA